MSGIPSSTDESQRLQRLRDYDILDSNPEEALNELAALAGQICETPIALISLVDETRQWFKASIGLKVLETPREVSFCQYAISAEEMLVVPDATQDNRFSLNPFVTGEPHIRFYAGAPLRTADGHVLGTLCVLDRIARELRPNQALALRVLSRQVMAHFELRRRELELAGRERLLHGIFQAEPECLHVFDADGVLQMINAAGAQILEADSSEQLIGRSVFSLVAAEDRPSFEALCQRVFRGESGILEFRAVSLKGKHIWLETHAAPWRDEQGNTSAILGITRDVTDRRCAEEALRGSEAKYRSLFDYAPEGILIVGTNNRYIDANPSICRTLGYTRDELLRIDPKEVSAPSEVERFEPAMRAVRAGQDYRREAKLRRKDGSMVEVEVMGTLAPDGNALAIILDVTEQKRTEARFRRLVEHSSQGVMFWNANGEIRDANDAFLRMIGYSRAEMETGGVDWRELTPPEFADRDRKALAEVLRTGTCAPFEKEYIRKDGTRVPVMLGVVSFDDSPQEGVCFVLDLTERKRLEEQFLRAQRMESLGTLAGGIAHDLNNALGPIMTSLELLKLEFPNPEGSEILDLISSSVQRGSEMVRQVLTFARGVPGARVPVSPAGLLREVARIANDTFSKNIRVETRIPSELSSVVGDSTQLHQVLLNLCVNARDAMPEGGLLTLSAKDITFEGHDAEFVGELKPGRYVVLAVKDSGIGIPPAIQDKIFDPFFTTKGIGRGTGLGLSTSQAIVKNHEGLIQLQSVPGQGTEFIVYLPALTEKPAEQEIESDDLPRGHGELIVVIEDEKSLRTITHRVLERFGYRVLEAANGAEALSIFGRQGQEVGAVLTDMMMPLMDGLTTIQVIRKINPGVPIVCASGLNDGEMTARARGLGVRHFMAKPFTTETLLVTLRDALQARD